MSQENSAERRRSFRVNDCIGIQIRRFDQQTLEEEKDRFAEHRSEIGLVNEFMHQRDMHLPRLTAIQSRSPDTASYIRYLESKIDTLAGLLLVRDLNLPRHPTHKVNLSGTGVRFYHDERIPEDETIEMQLLLFPSHALIPCFGTVVWSEHDPTDEEPGRHSTAIDFSLIHPDDEDILIKHTVTTQMQDLRNAHAEE